MLVPDALEHLARGRVVTLVSATNGKTAVTSLLTAALHADGIQVATNTGGANMLPGLATALGRDRAATHAVLEVDEAVLPTAIAQTRPALVVLGELSRDQLDRHHEVARLSRIWRDAFAFCDAQIVAPANDPNVAWSLAGRPVSWVDVDAHAELDAVVCLRCDGILDREPFGPGWCCRCGRVKPRPVAVQRGTALHVAGGSFDLPMALRGRWQYANRALAVVAASRLGVSVPRALAATSRVARVGARPNTVRTRSGRDARLVLVKNPAGWAALIEDLLDDASTILFVQNDDAADGRDPSWLWDVPYERLRPRRVIASGTRYLDVAVRMQSAGLDLVGTEPDPDRAIAQFDAAERLVVVASYTAHEALMRRAARR